MSFLVLFSAFKNGFLCFQIVMERFSLCLDNDFACFESASLVLECFFTFCATGSHFLNNFPCFKTVCNGSAIFYIVAIENHSRKGYFRERVSHVKRRWPIFLYFIYFPKIILLKLVFNISNYILRLQY